MSKSNARFTVEQFFDFLRKYLPWFLDYASCAYRLSHGIDYYIRVFSTRWTFSVSIYLKVFVALPYIKAECCIYVHTNPNKVLNSNRHFKTSWVYRAVWNSMYPLYFSFLIMCVFKRTSRLMLLSSCEKQFASFLHDSKLLQEGSMITGITN